MKLNVYRDEIAQIKQVRDMFQLVAFKFKTIELN